MTGGSPLAAEAAHPRLRAAALRCARSRRINALIDKKLLAQKARQMRLEVTPAQVQQTLAQVLAQSKMTPKQLADILKVEGLSQRTCEARLARQLLRVKASGLTMFMAGFS